MRDDEEDDEEEYFSIDPSLLDKESFIRGAIPVLPVPWAIFCCALNVLLPGVGTVLSGALCLFACRGPGPRFAQPTQDIHSCNLENRLCSFLVNLVVGILQLATVLLCLVGWCWAIGWGIAIITIAKRNEEFLSERYPLRRRTRKRDNNIRVGVEGIEEEEEGEGEAVQPVWEE